MGRGGSGGVGGKGFWGVVIMRNGGGAGEVRTLVLGGPISKGVYSGGAPPGLETPSPKGALIY